MFFVILHDSQNNFRDSFGALIELMSGLCTINNQFFVDRMQSLVISLLSPPWTRISCWLWRSFKWRLNPVGSLQLKPYCTHRRSGSETEYFTRISSSYRPLIAIESSSVIHDDWKGEWLTSSIMGIKTSLPFRLIWRVLINLWSKYCSSLVSESRLSTFNPTFWSFFWSESGRDFKPSSKLWMEFLASCTDLVLDQAHRGAATAAQTYGDVSNSGAQIRGSQCVHTRDGTIRGPCRENCC